MEYRQRPHRPHFTPAKISKASLPVKLYANKTLQSEKPPLRKRKKHTHKQTHKQTKRNLPRDSMRCARGRGKTGGDLLSRLAGSIIGADGLNGSVRDGKRWDPVAVTTVMNSAGGPPAPGPGGGGRRCGATYAHKPAGNGIKPSGQPGSAARTPLRAAGARRNARAGRMR